jgi:uncharacterized protein YndB with AHSA1/START domain
VKGGQSEDRKRARELSSGRIVKKVWIRASTGVVYSALTKSRELIHWFCDRAAFNPGEGAEFTAWWRSGRSSQKGRAIVTRIVPGSALELLWIDEGSGTQEKSPKHTLSYEIQSKSGMTELIMTDKKESGDDEAMAILDQGWNSVLLELKDYCERKERSSKSRPRSKSDRSLP